MKKGNNKDLARSFLGMGFPFLMTGIIELMDCHKLSKWIYIIVGLLYIFFALWYLRKK